jgi:hypothetical protein
MKERLEKERTNPGYKHFVDAVVCKFSVLTHPVEENESV